MSRRTKITLLALVLAGLVAIPFTVAGVNALTGSASEATASRQLRNGPGGPRGLEGPMRGRMGMSGQATTVESEFDYLTEMIPHHEEAIASARVLLDGTDRPEMEAFAEEIIDTQSAEVSQMREWLATWYPERDTEVSYDPMMRDLTGLSGDELDRAFLEDMIGHHMRAVMMSQQLLAGDLAEHSEVVPFAEQIRDGQHAEIFQMRTWLADWFGVSAMGAMGMRR